MVMPSWLTPAILEIPKNTLFGKPWLIYIIGNSFLVNTFSGPTNKHIPIELSALVRVRICAIFDSTDLTSNKMLSSLFLWIPVINAAAIGALSYGY
jgi:hypothetical protein